MKRLQPLHRAQLREMSMKIAKKTMKAQARAITDLPKTRQTPKHLHHPRLAAQHQQDQFLLQDKTTAELPLGMNKRAMLETVCLFLCSCMRGADDTSGGTVAQDSDPVVALYTGDYDGGANCGKKVQLQNTENGKTVIAT